MHLVQAGAQAPQDRCERNRACDTAGAGHRGPLALVADDLVDACGLFAYQTAQRGIGALFGRAAQHCQRCLHAMREIGKAVADTFLALPVLLDQRVEVAAQAIEFARDRAFHPGRLARLDTLHRGTHVAQRRQSPACGEDLRGEQQQRHATKPAPQCAAEARQLGVQRAPVDRHRECVADRFPAVVLPRDTLRKYREPGGEVETGLSGAGIADQWCRASEHRTGSPVVGPVVTADFRIQAGVGLVESRGRQRCRQAHVTAFIFLGRGQQGVDVCLQLLAGRGFGAAAERAVECRTGQAEERDQDQQVADQQAMGDRAAHAVLSSLFRR